MWKHPKKKKMDRLIYFWLKNASEGFFLVPITDHPGGGASLGKMPRFIVRMAYRGLAQAAASLVFVLQNLDPPTTTWKKNKKTAGDI